MSLIISAWKREGAILWDHQSQIWILQWLGGPAAAPCDCSGLWVPHSCPQRILLSRQPHHTSLSHSRKWKWGGRGSCVNNLIKKAKYQSVQSFEIICYSNPHCHLSPFPLTTLLSSSSGHASHKEDTSLFCFIQVTILTCGIQMLERRMKTIIV